MKYKKIYIMGTSGSGKSHLAKIISKKLNIKHLDLDDIYWIKKYTKALQLEKRGPKLKKFLKNNKSWIIEGVYSNWSIEAIKKSDLIIWLDISLNKRLYRLIKRHIQRISNKKTPSKIKDTIDIIKYSYSYKKKSNKHHSSYYNHNKILKKHKKNYILLKNNKQINEFIKTIK